MKQLILIALLMITATAFAAGKQYYDYPDSPRLYDDARLLVYNNSSGSRNITGAKLKSEIHTNPVMKGPFVNYSGETTDVNGVPTGVKEYKNSTPYMYIRASDGAVVITSKPSR